MILHPIDPDVLLPVNYFVFLCDAGGIKVEKNEKANETLNSLSSSLFSSNSAQHLQHKKRGKGDDRGTCRKE
jgi:hypothetical protein